jgi:hypothetical protein
MNNGEIVDSLPLKAMSTGLELAQSAIIGQAVIRTSGNSYLKNV